MIAAMAHDRVIGADNQMPWHLPADLQHFKRTTLGKPVIMGRNTYESIGKALPGRQNIVISRNPDFYLDDADVVKNPEEAIQKAGNVDEVMVIGGGKIYQHFLPMCHQLYLTEIDLKVEGDTCFPDYQKESGWNLIETERHKADDKNQYDYCFITLSRA